MCVKHHHTIVILIIILAICQTMLYLPGIASASDRYGVYIGNDDINDIIYKSQNDSIVVIEGQAFNKKQISRLKNTGKTVYSYLNAGSLEAYRPYYDTYKKHTLKIYENWEDEYWIDVSNKDWQSFIGTTLAKKLVKKGIDGFFVDNCDVYYHYKNSKIYNGLNNILKRLRKTGKDIIINGGDVYVKRLMKDNKINLIDGVNQETVFSRIKDYDNDIFAAQKSGERIYFQSYLKKIKEKNKKVYLLEYTKNIKLKNKIIKYCRKKGYGYYISSRINLTG